MLWCAMSSTKAATQIGAEPRESQNGSPGNPELQPPWTESALNSVCISSFQLCEPIHFLLVKDNKHRTSEIMTDNYEILKVDKSSNLFLFLTKIQDEVHRYAITYHRNIKSKGALSSLLDVIPGIGEQRKKDLLRKFGSLKKMKEASLEELKEVLPEEVASNVYTYLKEI